MCQKSAALSRKLDQLIEFGLIESLAIGGAIHAGQNAAIKVASSTRPGKKILASIFQAGVRHAKTGSQIRPGILRASDAILGPEYAHIYKQGLKSSRMQRVSAHLASTFGLGKEAQDAADVVTGRRSKLASRVMNALPQSKITHRKSAGLLGGAIGAGIGAMVEPIVPAVNVSRTILSELPIGDRILKGRLKSGLLGRKPSPIRRSIEDYLVSPSLNKVQAIGYDAGHVARKHLRAFAPGVQ